MIVTSRYCSHRTAQQWIEMRARMMRRDGGGFLFLYDEHDRLTRMAWEMPPELLLQIEAIDQAHGEPPGEVG